MRPIDADALRIIKVEECEGYTIDYYAAGWKACIDWIKTLPTLDVVPVVRCRDCMYRGAVQCALATEYNQYRPGVDPDWFCAKGRRAKHETDLSAPDSCDMALVIAHAADIPMHAERIWMETRAGELWPLQYRYWDGDLLHFLDKYTAITDTVFAAVQYLVTWRCWTAKPTNEQREAVKWDE